MPSNEHPDMSGSGCDDAYYTEEQLSERIDEAQEEIFQIWSDCLAKAHIELFRKPLVMGDGETAEETIGGTVRHFVESVEGALNANKFINPS